MQASIDLVDVLTQLVNESSGAGSPAGWSGAALADRMSGRAFHGLTTGDLYITPDGDRLLDMDIFGFSTATNAMQVRATCLSANNIV